jgi:hypothetical protein
VVVVLEVSDVFVGLAVLDVVVVVLEIELLYYYFAEVLQFEDVGAFAFLIVTLQNSFLLLLGEGIGSILIESPLVVVEDVETLYHFFLEVQITDNN